MTAVCTSWQTRCIVGVSYPRFVICWWAIVLVFSDLWWGVELLPQFKSPVLVQGDDGPYCV